MVQESRKKKKERKKERKKYEHKRKKNVYTGATSTTYTRTRSKIPQNPAKIAVNFIGRRVELFIVTIHVCTTTKHFPYLYKTNARISTTSRRSSFGCKHHS